MYCLEVEMMYNLVSIDDYRLVNLEISAILMDTNINIINVRDEAELNDYLGKAKIDIHAIIWALNTNDEDVFKAIRKLKKSKSTSGIPVMTVSWTENDSLKMKAANSGVTGFLLRPYDENEVRRTIYNILGIDYKNMSRLTDDDIQTFDLQDMLGRELNAAGRGGHALSIMLITLVEDQKHSLRHFDMENGAASAKDEYISLLKKVIKTRLRDTDTCFRYDTQSIIVILPFADKKGMAVIEKKIKESFADNSLLKQKDTGYKLVITGATFPEDGRNKERLLAAVGADF
jgi:two-component system chemotaxis response regulator CheY